MTQDDDAAAQRGVAQRGVAQRGAAQRWAAELAGWRIPDEIVHEAPQSPWIHPVELFRVDPEAEPEADSEAEPESVPDTPSHRAAREALPPDGGSVLDVGCGGGRAALALVPPAVLVIGVDHQAAMLEAFAAAAESRGVAHAEILGDWPAVGAGSPVADAVVCHHVAYNVSDLAGFAGELAAHTRGRVVLELPQRHPLAAMAPLWRHFWNLERPSGPTAADACAVIREAGFEARLVEWQEDGGRRLATVPWRRQVEFMRIRLCLTPDRDDELASLMIAQGAPGPRQLATIWWDTVSRP